MHEILESIFTVETLERVEEEHFRNHFVDKDGLAGET